MPHDAVYDRSATSHAVNLFDMAAKYADVGHHGRDPGKAAPARSARAIEERERVSEAVLVLDMTRDSIAPEARAVEKRRAILPRAAAYLAWARGKGMPVVFVCSARRRTDKWFLKFWELANEIWTARPAADPRAVPAEQDTVVHKRRYSGFFGSDLELTLRELDVDALQLIGWSTSLAVATTAIDAWQLGFPTTVVSDLTIAHAWGGHTVEENQKWSLDYIAAMAKSKHRALGRTDAMSIDGRATRRALNGGTFDYYSLAAAEALGLAGVSRLPCSLKVVLENVLRQHAEGRSDGADIAAVAGWLATRRAEREIAFRFTRVLMPDSSGVPLLGDLAAMRDAMIRLGGDPARLNPSVPVDLVVDHSVMVDAYGVRRRGEPQPGARAQAQRRALRVPALGRAGLRQPAHRSAGQRHLPPDQPRVPRARGVDATERRCSPTPTRCSAWTAIPR